MRHPYENYLVSRDNYLNKPEDVIELSKLPTYSRATYYPGQRTDNLMISTYPEVKKFAEWFADRLSHDVFPGISMYEVYLCFHINDPCPDPDYNHGWIHNDYGNLAGLVYLTPGEDNINTGTSIFTGELNETELPSDTKAREEFHLYGKITPDFVNGFNRNQGFFKDKETIRIGNKYNRLVAYDSKMWHRPNSYSTSVDSPRLSLLFFISRFNFVDTSKN
jgi:hypothetical protein